MLTGWILFGFLAFAFLLNLAFGRWRVSTRRFSLQWFVATHFPIALVILLRAWLGGSWKLLPLTLILSVLGQLLGGKMKQTPLP